MLVFCVYVNIFNYIVMLLVEWWDGDCFKGNGIWFVILVDYLEVLYYVVGDYMFF